MENTLKHKKKTTDVKWWLTAGPCPKCSPFTPLRTYEGGQGDQTSATSQL